MYKRICFLFGFISAIVPVFCRAEIIINEIMYDASGTDTNHEWIELFNNGTTPVDITGWKLFENDSNHGITPITASLVAPGGYAIIADNANQFKIDYPNVTVPLFDTTMSLSNTGETFALKNATLATVDQVTYESSLGATGNGNSLNRVATLFVEAQATPGLVNSTAVSNPPPVDTQTSTTSTQKKTEEIITPSISAEIIAPTSFLANTEVIFTPKISWTDGVSIPAGKLYWNFGDGFTETKQVAEVVRHTYTRAGKYVVVLEYSKNFYADIPDAVDQLIVTVDTAPLVFQRKDTVVVIKNTGTAQINLSGWAIVAKEKIIPLPRGTILLGGSELVVPSAFPANEVVTLQYPNSSTFAEIIPPPVVLPKQKISTSLRLSPVVPQTAILENAPATVLSAIESTPTAKTKSVGTTFYAGIGFLVLVVTAILLVIKIRRNKKPAEDTLSVDDIQIIDSEEE